jgi:hypothetical protein
MKIAVFVMASLLVMCAGHVDDALDPQARLEQLTADQFKRLCDWEAAAWGGYGASVGCDGSCGAAHGPVDQASCVSELLQANVTYPDCPLTVDQFEKCVIFGLQFQCVNPPATMPDPCVVGQSPVCSG